MTEISVEMSGLKAFVKFTTFLVVNYFKGCEEMINAAINAANLGSDLVNFCNNKMVG